MERVDTTELFEGFSKTRGEPEITIRQTGDGVVEIVLDPSTAAAFWPELKAFAERHGLGAEAMR